jgi:acyl-CoA synthetase (AMP-forming)/AMP-acid ligase II
MTIFTDEVRKFCGERLAGFKKPKSVDFWADLPKSPQGKILKTTIREFYKKLQTNP